ncbi:hypothetical protein CRYUN_Cryun18bG0026200 [Craigia yunnanensis]
MLCSCHCLLSCVYREKLRTKFGLPAEPCNDCCVHFCCEACALCQEHAELKTRGFDPSRGCFHNYSLYISFIYLLLLDLIIRIFISYLYFFRVILYLKYYINFDIFFFIYTILTYSCICVVLFF